MSDSLLRYRRLPDLYATGSVFEAGEGVLIWLQVINSLERSDALQDAFAAQARLALALDDDDSDDSIRMRIVFEADGREAALDRLRDTQSLEAQLVVLDEISVEEDWKERVAVVQRTDDLASIPSEAEREVVRKIMLDFVEEFERRLTDELAHRRAELEHLDDDALFREYRQWWAKQRGSEVGIVEYRYTELAYSARACSAVQDAPDGPWRHDACEQHTQRIWTRDEVKSLPEGLLEALFTALADQEVGEREAKSQARTAGSSDSSAPPRPQEDSERSMSTETSEVAPGT